ncbi:MAG: hypothetical protein QOD91_2604 [Frankiales bacterium]|nr:hypothetical protein [Frankiales bacterium]
MALDQARGDTADSEQPLPRRGDFARRHWSAVTAPVAYLLGSICLYWPLFRHLRSAAMGGPDASLFTWWLGWTPYAISHGHSPFVSTWINAPHGVNAMWNTSVPLLGVLMSPVTETWGPVASVNLLLIAAPALSAWSAFLAGRLLGLRARSALLAGFLYGFSTHVIAENSGAHLHLSLAVFPPLVAALLTRIVDGKVSGRRGGLLLGLAAVLQVWISEEILATSVILAVAALAVLAVRTPRDVAVAAGRRLLTAAAWAMVIAIPVAAPALIIQFFGAGHLSSGVPITHWSTDPFTAFTPTPQAAVGALLPTHTMQQIQAGDADEVTGYLGLPLLILLLVSRRRLRSSPLHWCWTPLLVAAVLALGWTIRLAGHDTHIRGPGQLMQRLPVLQNIVTVRFSLYVVLFAALLAAAAWDSADVAGPRTQRWALGLVALAVVAVFPHQSGKISRISDPPAFASGKLLPGLPDGTTLAMLPWPNTLDASAMRWQAVDKMHYKLLGAWGIVVGPHGEGSYGAPTPALARVAHHLSGHTYDPPPPGGGTERLLLAEVKIMSARAKALVVGPVGNSAQVASYLSGLLHERPTYTGGVYVFRLPAP